MALIDKRFVHFQTRAEFNKAQAANEIQNDSIVFIKNEKRIWTHGEFFSPESFSKVLVDNTELMATDIYSVIKFITGEGLNITLDSNKESATYGCITYSHADTSSVVDVTTTNGKFISAITFDKFGHVLTVTSTETKSYSNIVAGNETDVTGTTAELTNGNVNINVVEKDSISGNNSVVKSSIKIQGRDNVDVTATNTGVIEVSHKKAVEVTKTGGGESTADSVDVLSSAGIDAYGHLISLGTLPVPTKKYVDSKVSGLKDALDTSLLFCGVIGTGTNMIPWETANQKYNKTTVDGKDVIVGSKLGDIYKIGTAGTYSNEVCQAGDLIVCVSVDSNGIPSWAVIQGNTDVANDAIIGLVKGGYQTDENSRNFAVKIDASGAMWVNVPFEYTNKSTSIVTNDATKTEGTNADIANGSVRINHLETSKSANKQEITTVKSSINIKGDGATSVTANASGDIIISSHDSQFSISVTETAANKTIKFLKDGVQVESFEFDAWAERD